MPRHVALLRGVSPMNAKMPELKRCFERAGFSGVRTVRSSGNVVFDSTARGEAALARKAEAAMQSGLGRTFATQVRTLAHLRELLDADPFAAFDLPAAARRVVTFLGEPAAKPELPIEAGDARVLAIRGREVLSVYIPGSGSQAFAAMLEKAFGKAITTRTWDTLRKCAAA